MTTPVEHAAMLPCLHLALVAKDFVPATQTPSAKITHFFKGGAEKFQASAVNSDEIIALPKGCSIVQFLTEEKNLCKKCGAHISTTMAEHEDYHVALELSAQWNDQRPAKKAKQGPMDFFVKR